MAYFGHSKAAWEAPKKRGGSGEERWGARLRAENYCFEFRKVEKQKSKSEKVSFWILKSRKVEKSKGIVLNFEKSKSKKRYILISKSRKVRKGIFYFRKVEKSKSILFDFSLFDLLKFYRMPFQPSMRTSFFQLRGDVHPLT